MIQFTRITKLFYASPLARPPICRCLLTGSPPHKPFNRPKLSAATTTTRQNSIFTRLFTRKRRTVESFKIDDAVPLDYHMIYRNTMTKYIYLAQNITAVTTTVLCLVYINYGYSLSLRESMDEQASIIEPWSDSVRSMENELTIYVATFIGVLVILQILVSRLPVRIYRVPNSQKYLFIVHGKWPFPARKYTCKRGELVQMEESGVLPWRDSRYMIRDSKQVILIDHYFRKPADLSIMLGEQKDSEFEDHEK